MNIQMIVQWESLFKVINYLLEWIRVCQVFLQASKAYICATQFPGLSSKSVSYQVKDEFAPNLFKKKKSQKKVLSGSVF